jgi:hypothetical protein
MVLAMHEAWLVHKSDNPTTVSELAVSVGTLTSHNPYTSMVCYSDSLLVTLSKGLRSVLGLKKRRVSQGYSN